MNSEQIKQDIQTLTEIQKRVQKLCALHDSEMGNINLDDADAALEQAIKSLESFAKDANT